MRKNETLQPEQLQVAIIGASLESVHAVKTARKMGASVIALDDDENAVGFQYANTSLRVNIKDHAQLYRIFDEYRPKMVLPAPIGRYLTSIGAVNDHYGLPGVTSQAAVACTDKHLFHMLLHEKGKRQAEHILVNATDAEPLNTFRSFQYPVVAKPRYGSGNRAVQIYMDPRDFQKNFLSLLPLGEDFVVESCVQGVEYGLDAAMIHNTLHLVLLREKVLTPYPYSQCVGYYSVRENASNSTLFHNVRTSVAETCKILGINDCLLHADVMYNDAGAFVIEVSARPSGHNLHNLFTPLATGVDIIAEYLHFALPQLEKAYSFTPEETKNMLIRYFDFAHCRVKYLPDSDGMKTRDYIRDYKCNLQAGEVLQPVKDGPSLMRRGYFIVEGADRGELDVLSKEIMSQFVLEDA